MLEALLFFLVSGMIFYYLATAMQWYSYRLSRVLLHFSKPRWHLFFVVIPFVVLSFTAIFHRPIWFVLFLAPYIVLFGLWLKGIDKKLVFTARIKRASGIFIAFLLLFKLVLHHAQAAPIVLLLTLVCAYIVSELIERKIAFSFEIAARKKLAGINPTVIAITASFGKTSIKNFVAHILSQRFNVYATPASVNTKIGIIRDINEKLSNGTDIYVVEAGARQKGDIREIAALVEPHYSIVGKIGEAHIEYFKTLDTIRDTKSELLASKRLRKAFVFENVERHNDKTAVFGYHDGIIITDVVSTLDGVSFSLLIDGAMQRFSAPNICGAFNAINLAAAVLVAKELGMNADEIIEAVKTIPAVAHRLQKIDTGTKLILDDSFNGNFDGIHEGIELAKTFNGQKTIVTCGLIESRPELNIALAHEIDAVFDTAIITGEANKALFAAHLKRCSVFYLREKRELETLLKTQTPTGSLVYFANDAPGYI